MGEIPATAANAEQSYAQRQAGRGEKKKEEELVVDREANRWFGGVIAFVGGASNG